MNTGSILTRLLESVLIVICIITLNFFLIRFMPGDPVMHIIGEEDYFAMEKESPEVIERIRADYGLDRSLTDQYLSYMKKTVSFDFGNSYRLKTPVLETVLFRLKWTLWLAIPATVIAAILGGWLGLKAGSRPGGRMDSIFTPFFLVLGTIPTNCLAILFLIGFAFKAGIFPISGITSGGLTGIDKTLDIIHHMILPMSVLAVYKTASNYMLMKSTAAMVCGEEYVTTAISKGLTPAQVRKKHILVNAVCPYMTSICMQFGNMLAGSMMTEVVFSWKGMGTLIYDSVNTKDFPMLQTCFLVTAVCVVIFNRIADILCFVIDPRLRGEGQDAE